MPQICTSTTSAIAFVNVAGRVVRVHTCLMPQMLPLEEKHLSPGHGALLDWAGRDGALLDGAAGHGALLDGTTGQGALLDRAGGQGALLDGASGEGALLDRASGEGEGGGVGEHVGGWWVERW